MIQWYWLPVSGLLTALLMVLILRLLAYVAMRHYSKQAETQNLLLDIDETELPLSSDQWRMAMGYSSAYETPNFPFIEGSTGHTPSGVGFVLPQENPAYPHLGKVKRFSGISRKRK